MPTTRRQGVMRMMRAQIDEVHAIAVHARGVSLAALAAAPTVQQQGIAASGPPVKLFTGAVPLSQLRAAGPSAGPFVFLVGSPLPANARLWAAEAVVTALAAPGLSSATGSLEGATSTAIDVTGAILSGMDLTLTKTVTGPNAGLDSYFSRGLQQLQTTIVLYGASFNELTAGAVMFRALYTVILP